MSDRTPSAAARLLFLLFLALGALALVSGGDAQETPPAQTEEKQEPQAISLLGRELYALPQPAGTDIHDRGLDALHLAQKQLFEGPESPENWITLGIAYSESWRYRDAINTYTEALQKYPTYAMLYRHRGHRYLSLRDFDHAVADLERAAELEQGSFDIWYHLGLAHYLRGEYGEAAAAYRHCKEVIGSDDDLVAVSHWLYMTLRRDGRKREAREVLAGVREGMEVKENVNYYHLLLFYQGLRTEEQLLAEVGSDSLQYSTTGYGLANWHLYNGRKAQAVPILERIVAGHFWPAFGFIAAEAELARLQR